MISTAELTEWLAAEPEDADTLRMLERAAVLAVQERTGRFWGSRQTLTETRTWYGDTLELAAEPVGGVVTGFLHWTGSAWETVGSDTYLVDGTAILQTGARTYTRYRVTYEAGPVADPDDSDVWDAPEDIKQAVRMLVGHWFANREGVVVGTTSAEVGLGVDMLTRARRRTAL